MDETRAWEGRKWKQSKSCKRGDNKQHYMFLRVTLARVPKESPNQNKDCLNYELDLGKTTQQTRKWIMQIKEEKEQLCNRQNAKPNLITTWPFPTETSRSRNRSDRLHPAWEPTQSSKRFLTSQKTATCSGCTQHWSCVIASSLHWIQSETSDFSAVNDSLWHSFLMSAQIFSMLLWPAFSICI